MPFKILLFLSITLLAACAPSVVVPSATLPVASSTATETSTPTQTPTPEATATPTETPTPEVKQYPICPDVTEFRNYPITVEDLFPKEGETESAYLRWLKTLSKPFDPNKIKFVPVVELSDQTIIPDPNVPHNYEDASQRPFRRNVTCGMTTYQGIDYMVLPVEFADPSDPGNSDKNSWIIGVFPLAYLGNDLGKPLPSYRLNEMALQWRDQMTIMPIVDGIAFPAGTVPLAEYSWQKNNLAQGINNFKSGNPSSLNGKLVLTDIARLSSWYSQ